MRISRALPATIILSALAVAACATSEPGWTYAPPPSTTPAPSVQPSGAPPSGAPASEAPASGAPASEAPGSEAPASQAPGGETVQVSAQNIAFDPTELQVPADTPFQIEFANNDAGIPHNVEIKDAGGTSLFMGEVFNGVETRTYAAPALAAGSYQFICTVHPNMVIDATAG